MLAARKEEAAKPPRMSRVEPEVASGVVIAFGLRGIFYLLQPRCHGLERLDIRVEVHRSRLDRLCGAVLVRAPPSAAEAPRRESWGPGPAPQRRRGRRSR
jgi:hypothetical protein